MSTATLVPPAPAASTPPAAPTTPAALAPVGPAAPNSRPPLEESAARQALDLAQQGFLVGEIGELLDLSPVCVEQALEAAVPGGSATIAGALRRRLRAWRREHENSPWWEAEVAFGVPHAHVLRLVRVPRDREIGVVAAGEPGYLDTVLAGDSCRDQRASRSARLYTFCATLQEIGDLFGVTRERIRQILGKDTRGPAPICTPPRRPSPPPAAPSTPPPWPAGRTPPGGAPGGRVPGAGPGRGAGAPPAGPAPHPPRARVRRPAREHAPHRGGDHRRSPHLPRRDRCHHLPGLHRLGAGAGRARSAVQAENGGTTFRAVEEWLAAHPAAPSGALIRQRLCGHEGGSWSETVTTALAVLREPDTFDPAWVQDVTAPRDWDADPAQEDPLDHVRAAIAALGPRITTARYAAWARQNGRPTVAALQRRTGTVWTAILAAAGGEPNAAKVKNRSRAEVAEYVRRFLAAHPSATTVEYARWAPQHGAPSLTTVIGRYGTWSGALEACR